MNNLEKSTQIPKERDSKKQISKEVSKYSSLWERIRGKGISTEDLKKIDDEWKARYKNYLERRKSAGASQDEIEILEKVINSSGLRIDEEKVETGRDMYGPIYGQDAILTGKIDGREVEIRARKTEMLSRKIKKDFFFTVLKGFADGKELSEEEAKLIFDQFQFFASNRTDFLNEEIKKIKKSREEKKLEKEAKNNEEILGVKEKIMKSLSDDEPKKD